MTDNGYLVLNRRGIVRMTKRVPSLRSGEILVRLNVSYEPELFDPSTVNLTITRNHVMDDAIEVPNRVPRVGLQYVPGLDDEPTQQLRRYDLDRIMTEQQLDELANR